MNLLDKITDFVGGGLFKEAKNLITEYWPPNVSPEKRAEFDLKLAQIQAEKESQALQIAHDEMTAQTEINKIEASSTSLFVAGWRPSVGWICAIALGYAAVLEPLSRFVAKVWFGYEGDFPAIDTTITMQVLFGMLGFGGLRSYEKIKGVASTSNNK